TVPAVETPIGYIPEQGALEISGLHIALADMEELLRVDAAQWAAEIPDIREHFTQFGDRLPQELREQLNELEKRLQGK
ncbi:MAG: phosphoenolpyruvate carboxykinase domain-containing protein, partial [Pseudomonadota bacterium]